MTFWLAQQYKGRPAIFLHKTLQQLIVGEQR